MKNLRVFFVILMFISLNYTLIAQEEVENVLDEVSIIQLYNKLTKFSSVKNYRDTTESITIIFFRPTGDSAVQGDLKIYDMIEYKLIDYESLEYISRDTIRLSGFTSQSHVLPIVNLDGSLKNKDDLFEQKSTKISDNVFLSIVKSCGITVLKPVLRTYGPTQY